MKEKIVITGAAGIIGKVLCQGLSPDYQTTPLDLPESDVRDYQNLVKTFPGHRAVIHLAWVKMKSGSSIPENTVMFENVYLAALNTGVKRVIMASSVHADNFYKPEGKIMHPYDLPVPNGSYGAHKVFMEMLGRWYASEKSLEVICLRFGNVNSEDKPCLVKDPSNIKKRSDRAVWLSHRDCVSLINCALKPNKIPNNFSITYGVSNNPNRVHDLSNPLNWSPQDSADPVL